MDIFESASRKKLRFPSVRGELTAEQLWDLQLVAAVSARDIRNDLDTVARAINTELKSVTEESFVATRQDPRRSELELKLAVVKHIIAVKLKAQEDAKTAVEKAQKKAKLLEVLGQKRDQSLNNKTEEEILKELEALGE